MILAPSAVALQLSGAFCAISLFLLLDGLALGLSWSATTAVTLRVNDANHSHISQREAQLSIPAASLWLLSTPYLFGLGILVFFFFVPNTMSQLPRALRLSSYGPTLAAMVLSLLPFCASCAALSITVGASLTVVTDASEQLVDTVPPVNANQSSIWFTSVLSTLFVAASAVAALVALALGNGPQSGLFVDDYACVR